RSRCRGPPKITLAVARAAWLAADRPAGPSSPKPIRVSQGSRMTRILLLSGTSEANLVAQAMAKAGLAGVYSYAGRTEAPMGQPIHMRVGGFGGVKGLRAYLEAEGITHVIDATHPFAAQMSSNAVAACEDTDTPLIALERAP